MNPSQISTLRVYVKEDRERKRNLRRLVVQQGKMCEEVTHLRNQLTKGQDELLVSGGKVREKTASEVLGRVQVESERMRQDSKDTPKDFSHEDSEIEVKI